MRVEPTSIPDVKLVVPVRHADHRGYFIETYNQHVFASHGVLDMFVQDNVSLSATVGTIRGLHFQIQPYAQAKLVRVSRGRILDVAVDIRKGSPTYGAHVAIELSADDPAQMLVPIGFAHGYVTLEPDTEVNYKVTNFYSPADERGLMWNDPALGIDWGGLADPETLSGKDRGNPPLAALSSGFAYGGAAS
jgi:dTDP-4-dehydrorhamnose 3,5-epimerase